jgi:hypothetical protein
MRHPLQLRVLFQIHKSTPISDMELSGEGAGVYAEAKAEYTKQLCQFMLPALQQYFLDMLDDAKQKEPLVNKVLLMFQELLEAVPEWNADKVQRETTALAKSTQCDYLEELLTAVFIAHTKVLSAIRLTSRQKKLQITIPRLEHFLHKTLIECSRLIWSNTYLFSTTAPSIERQKNLRLIESILNDGIHQSIRSMLPVKNILREYLKEDDEAEVEAEEEKEEEEEGEEKPAALAEEKPAAAEEKPVTPAEEKPVTPAEEKPVTPAEEKPVTPAEEKPSTTVIDLTKEPKAEESQLFTGIDTAFVEKEEPIKEFVPELAETEEEIKFLDDSPEPMDGFEELGNETETLPMEFEEL